MGSLSIRGQVLWHEGGRAKGRNLHWLFSEVFYKTWQLCRLSFFKKWEREKSTSPSLDQEPITAAMMRKSTLCLLPVRNSWLLSHSWDRIIKSEKIAIALCYWEGCTGNSTSAIHMEGDVPDTSQTREVVAWNALWESQCCYWITHCQRASSILWLNQVWVDKEEVSSQK